MRLIDADELKEQLYRLYWEAVERKSETYYYLEAIMTVDNAQTIDAVPREELLNTLNGRLDFLKKWKDETTDFKKIAEGKIEDCEEIIDIVCGEKME